jgi:hypothetical protein
LKAVLFEGALMPEKKKRAIIWAAVSTRMQADEEMYSLPAQEDDGKKLAERMGWEVIDVLTIPGHSRRYIDIHECASDMAAQGITAFVKLMQHWRDRDFDVLVVRDGERFARTQTLHSHVTETTIGQGAIIYSLQDGEINENNYRMWIAMAGYKAAGDIDRLVQHLKRGIKARVEAGLPARIPPMSHRVVRNPANGKALGLEIVEELLPVWYDIAKLLLEGVSYQDIELVLRDRFGHVRPDGTAYSQTTVHRLFLNPVFWGHNYTYPYEKGHRFRLPTGPYMLEPGHEVPPGVSIYYNVRPPVLDGEIGEQVKAELKRRMNLRGNTRPHSTSMFANILVCGECGANMSAANQRTGWKCFSNWQGRTTCSQTKQISRQTVIDYLNQHLILAMNNEWPDPAGGQDNPERRIEIKEKEIEQYKKQIRTLIQKQARVEDESELSSIYDQEIAAVNRKLKRAQEDRDAIALEPFDQERVGREYILSQMRERELEDFWKRDDLQIQQDLRTILGQYRLLVLQGQIVRVAVVLPKEFRHRPTSKKYRSQK